MYIVVYVDMRNGEIRDSIYVQKGYNDGDVFVNRNGSRILKPEEVEIIEDSAPAFPEETEAEEPDVPDDAEPIILKRSEVERHRQHWENVARENGWMPTTGRLPVQLFIDRNERRVDDSVSFDALQTDLFMDTDGCPLEVHVAEDQ
jgi:hypothetical protein